jgi:Tfp pilus assembly major pilin PilA
MVSQNLQAVNSWTKIYQAFTAADFQSYDFQTIRKAMIDYLRLNYAENFNDFIDSSEYIALIELIAFFGQNLAFRGDLNARENFIDTAERRDSILKLARLVSYNPSRNIPANGQLKIISLSTSESVIDSLGNNISNISINWNDPSNLNWQEQFNAILNASFSAAQKVGTPAATNLVNNITTNVYQVNSLSNVLPVFSFQNKVNGTNTPFEATGTDINSGTIAEVAPTPGAPFTLFYQNDNAGNASANTGFFVRFTQGTLAYQDFNIAEVLTNRVISVNFDNINNTDIWLYQLDANNNPSTLWEQVPAISGVNIAFNSIAATNRNIYQVVSRANDQVDLVFGDGVFANIPQGTFRVYYRVSNGLTYVISPTEMQRIVIPVNYISRLGRIETMTVTASLQYTVATATSRESLADIKLKAPQQYYTQNRMVNGEDYNIFPYTSFSTIVKAKAVNRVSSGISRFIDVVDVTGTYSGTNIFCDDGIIYQEEDDQSFAFTFTNKNDINNVITGPIQDALENPEMLQFFYANFPRFTSALTWNQVTTTTSNSTGYFTDANGKIVELGSFSQTNNKYITQGALIKFTAPIGQYFSASGLLMTGTPINPSDTEILYLQIGAVTGDGTANGTGTLTTGFGPVVIDGVLPSSAIVTQIIPQYQFQISSSLSSTILTNFVTNVTFGIRYDIPTSSLVIINSQNLNTTTPFSLQFTGDTSNQNLDNSWLIWFQPTATGYTAFYRGLAYIFESVNETTFYFDPLAKVYDSSTGQVVADTITVLKINAQPDSSVGFPNDISCSVLNAIVASDGYVDPNRVKVTFSSINGNGAPDNPDFFINLVNPTVNPNNKIVFFQQSTTYGGYIKYNPLPPGQIIAAYATQAQIKAAVNNFTIGTVFYATSEQVFYQSSNSINSVTGLYTATTLSVVTNYITRVGRYGLYFQYKHNATGNRRIDPSPMNLIDIYLLTQSYDTSYRNWIQDTTGTVSQPSAPTTDELFDAYNSLNTYKMISDELVFNSAVYKPLFGSKADPSLQANFLVVMNPSTNATPNEVQTSIIGAINNFFSVSNWDFGETFYYSELAAYLHTQLASEISSVLLVPASNNQSFGSMMQVNANFNEILISAATVDNVQIISSITAAQIKSSNVIFS